MYALPLVGGWTLPLSDRYRNPRFDVRLYGLQGDFVRDSFIIMPHGQISVAWLPCDSFGDYEPSTKTC